MRNSNYKLDIYRVHINLHGDFQYLVPYQEVHIKAFGTLYIPKERDTFSWYYTLDPEEPDVGLMFILRTLGY